MSQTIHLNWAPSAWASYFLAARTVMRGETLLDSQLTSTLAEPVQRVQAELDFDRIPGEIFWSHVVPLSATSISIREVSEVTLIKLVGRGEMPARRERFTHALIDVKQAAERALPDLEKVLATRAKSLRQAWDYQGLGLLAALKDKIEPDLLVEEARVIAAYTSRPGGGTAYLPHNQVEIEAMAEDPAPELPEIVRLAWLLSMLNLDVPRYSEKVSPQAHVLVANLAMIPAVLETAATLSLASYDETTIARALQLWLSKREELESSSSLLHSWWETYKVMRPRLGEALAGLERLLAE